MTDVREQITRAKDDAAHAWIDRAKTLVTRRLRDTRVHAEHGAWNDAEDRLDELSHELTERTLSAAREQFLHDAFRVHRHTLPLGAAGNDLEPTVEGVRIARTATIGTDQTDQHAELRRLVTRAKRDLRTYGGATATKAGFDAWEARHRTAIGGAVATHLSDAQIALHEAVGRLLIYKSDDLE